MCDMLKVGVYFGYQICYWNLKMGKFIFGVCNKIYIINFEKILLMFNEVLIFVECLVVGKNKILFVGIKCFVGKIVCEEVVCCGMLYVDYCWLGGMFINYKIICQLIKCLCDLEIQFQDGIFDKLIKKEVLMCSCDFEKFECSLGGIKDMGGLLDVLFVIDVDYECIVIIEVNKLGILVIGVVDINSSLEGVDYVIFGNDDVICVV